MTPSATAPAIEADDLRKTFRGKRQVVALDGVSFAVEPGTVFGLLGPNGAGKTTAVRILTTIIRPDGGSARVLGYDVTEDPTEVRRRIGLAGQYAAVDEILTGVENLHMIGRLNHLDWATTRRRAGELLEQFELADAGDRPLKTYSGGMRRRLDLAAALMTRPPVLFLDEPTTGLDPQSRNGLWTVIEQLVAGGTTVLLTTQYLEEADRLADRVAVVDVGRIIAEGTPSELKASLGATVLEIGLGDPDVAATAAAHLEALGMGEAIVVGATVELPVDDGAHGAVDVIRELDARGTAPVTFTMREPSLDDVFLQLTGHRAEQEPGDDGAAPAGHQARGRRSREGAER